MIKAIIRWSLDNRIFILIAMFFLILMGIYALKETPIDAIPDLSDVQVIIKTAYPGQAPQVVEDQVTYPLSTAMLAVPGAVTVRAYSFYGDSYVYVIFEDGTDLYWARSRVLEYLNQELSKLPIGVRPALGPDATGVGWVYQYALIDKTGKNDLADLTTLQNWLLKYELQTVSGVAEVATVGGMVKQYQVTLEPNQLRVYGLTLQKVKEAIKKASSEVGGSVIEMSESEYMVRTSGYIQSLKALGSIPLGVNVNGTPILLSSIAHIGYGPQMRRGIGELNGQGEAVGGIVVMRMGSNALTTINSVKEKLADIKTSLPQGVDIIETYDRSVLIKNTISNLKMTLIEEMAIVILVCFVFLYHLRSSLVVLVTLPLGLLGAFIIMYLQGINANLMSLGGIAIAIGDMVDPAIVMIENSHKWMAGKVLDEKQRWEAVKKATMQVGPPIFFSTLITALSFLPVFALQAQEGRLFTPLAYTKTYAMLVAAIVSITFVPVLIGYFVRGKILPENNNPVNRILIRAYQPVIDFVLKRPVKIIFAGLIFVMLSYFPYSQLGTEFMPELDEGDWMYMPTTLPSISIGKARQILQQTDKLIMTVPEVKSVYGKIGRAETATDPAPLTMIESVVQLKPKSEWRDGMTSEKLKMELNRVVNLPGVTNAWVMPIKTRIDMLATGIKTPIGIKITGSSLKEIQNIGEHVAAIIKNVKGTASVYADRAVGGRYVNIDINREAAGRYGLSVNHIHEVVATAIGGVNVIDTVEGRERYPVNMRYPQADRDSVESIRMLPLVTPNGAHIPLADVANVYIAEGPPSIKSEDAKLVGWVLVDIENTDIGTYIEDAKMAVQKQLTLPVGYRLIWSGQYEYMQRAQERIKLIGPVTLMIITLLLYITFRRFSEVLIVLLTLPMALCGGLWLLYLLGYHLSVAVGVGFIALAGVSIEIGILMLVYLNQALDELKQGQHTDVVISDDDLRSAISNAATKRIRPIAMTVISTVLGLLPIMLGTGTGSEVMRRFAAPMVGGMIGATILTLIMIPAVYYTWKKRLLENEIK